MELNHIAMDSCCYELLMVAAAPNMFRQERFHCAYMSSSETMPHVSGERFGADDYLGHGHIMDEKRFEVPLLEGLAK